jgi:GNAT superfamily N-acetyltransferase
MHAETILIREIALIDAAVASQLCAELGYPTAVDLMEERIGMVTCSRDHSVYVACMLQTVVGWIDVCISHHLSTGLYGEIGGLIVSGEYRGSGIGRKLIARAEQWVADQGVTRMVVRSRTAREEAHRFYLRAGYSMTKTSAVFSKELRK